MWVIDAVTGLFVSGGFWFLIPDLLPCPGKPFAETINVDGITLLFTFGKMLFHLVSDVFMV